MKKETNNKIENDRLLKGLNTQLSKLKGDTEVLKTEIGNTQRIYQQKLRDIESIQNRIKSLETNVELKVSEHAIVRYFERVKGYDISEIEKEILSDEIKRMVDVLGGTGSFPNKNFSVKMVNNTVTTVV